jgi:FixJ family two-component response regulator
MGANKLLIAVVDDDAAIRKALQRLLSSADMNVATFDSGQAFLDSLANQSPDCLILDLHMPGISGLELLQGLSRIDVVVPTIVITAYDERAMECLAAGAQVYLRKPVDDRVLLSAIESAIRTHTVR